MTRNERNGKQKTEFVSCDVFFSFRFPVCLCSYVRSTFFRSSVLYLLLSYKSMRNRYGIILAFAITNRNAMHLLTFGCDVCARRPNANIADDAECIRYDNRKEREMFVVPKWTRRERSDTKSERVVCVCVCSDCK